VLRIRETERLTAAIRTARFRVEEELFARGRLPARLQIAEFPKSGGTWLWQLMLALEQEASAPGLKTFNGMRVIHHHAPFGSRSIPAVYVLRDGRDVVVSLYFHHLREIRGRTRWEPRVRRYFSTVLGSRHDPEDVTRNLPRFIRSLRDHPLGGLLRPGREASFLTWPTHVVDWSDRVGVTWVRYEDMLANPVAELERIIKWRGFEIEPAFLEEVVTRNSFRAQSGGRAPGQEDRSSFLRKGIVGDWKNWFDENAAAAFDEYGGDQLRAFGYDKPRRGTA